MRVKWVCLFFIFLIFPTPVFAKKLSGSIDLSYQKDKIYDSGSKSKKTIFTQDYKIVYNSFLYTPRFLNYTIDAEFKRDRTKDTTDFSSGASTVDSPALNFRLNFLGGTRYPVTVYKERQSAMTDSTTTATNILTRTKTDRQGIYGSYFMKKSLLNLKYDLRQDRTNSTTSFGSGGGALTQTTTGRYSFGFDKTFDVNKVRNAGTAMANYTYTQTKDKVNNQFDGIHAIDGSLGGLRPTKNSSFNMSANYSHNNPSQMTTYTSNMYYNYNKSANYTLSSSMYLNRLVDRTSDTNYSTLYLSSSYKISESLNTNQNVVLYRRLGKGSETTESGSLTLAFSKPVYGFGFYANSSVYGSATQMLGESHTNTQSYSASAGFSRTVPIKTAQASFRGSYSISGGHPSSRSYMYTVGTGISLRLFKNVNLQSNIDKNQTDTFTSSSSNIAKTTVFANTLSYSVPLGLKGAVGVNFGAAYTDEKLPNKTYTSGLTLSYAVLKGLVLRSDLAYIEDTRSESETKSLGMSLHYERKKFKIAFDNRLMQTSDHNNKKLNASTTVKASRAF
ncbi:MAG: hypothetical protein EPN22_13015 [Nitrospirae bacterium]|nr:MAG: hypothetical protein EPN22_13015 [Nitrospirota bacterium]